jgi:hypothetical protein
VTGARYLTNGHIASDGTQGPGVAEVPPADAQDLAGRRYARILQPDEQPDDLGRTQTFPRGVSN